MIGGIPITVFSKFFYCRTILYAAERQKIMKKSFKLLAFAIIAAMLMSFASSAYVVLDTCETFQFDNTPKWGGTYVEANVTDEAPEGAGYVYGSVVDGVIVLAKGWEEIDISEYTDGYFIFDLYIEDAASVTSGQVEMYSGNQITYWSLLDLDIKDGWNTIALKISTGAIQNGGLDFSAFTSIRVFAYTTNTENVLGLDNLCIGKTEDDRSYQIDNCDSALEQSDFTGTSWSADDIALVSELGEDAAKEGEASIYRIAKDTLVIGANFITPFDISEYTEDGYLMFWLYMSDGYGTSLAGQIELTSSGAPDVEEISWSMAELSYIETGWNAVALPFASATTWMADTDTTAIDCFRIYDFVVTGEEVEMRIDNLCVGSYDDAVELGFIIPEEETDEDVTEEATEEVTEEATDAESVEETEEAVESEETAETEAESAEESEEAPAGATLSESTMSAGAIAAIIAAAVVVIAVIVIVLIVVKKKKN